MLPSVKSIIVYWISLLLFLPGLKAEPVLFDDGLDTIRLSNSKLALSFGKRSGRLLSMVNKVTDDNYIKSAQHSQLFRILLDPKHDPPISSAVYDYDHGGIVVDPMACSLTSYSFKPIAQGGELSLRYREANTGIEVVVKLRLDNEADYFDGNLMVKNAAASHRTMHVSFPYFSGIHIGEESSDNFLIDMWDRGYPGAKAWERPIGGVYGREVAMQWQCVYNARSTGDGLAFITMDTTFANKILCTSPNGGMQAFYFDKILLVPQESFHLPATRISVFSGGWKVAARQYDRWFRSAMNPRKLPDWYKNIGLRGSNWFPPFSAANQYSQMGWRPLKSFRELFDLYADRYDDIMEIAQWNDDVHLWPETYGPWMSSGFTGFRTDLGGIEAFREGVDRVHQLGRKVGLYVAGYGIRKTSPMFKGDSWKKWAIQDKEGNYNFDYRDGDTIHGIFVCPGYRPWQDHIIEVCKMIAETGVDEIRLDELGFPFKPCFNPHHSHSSPYDANKWMNEYLKRVRTAIDSINPELVLTTEYFVDYFNQYTNGALVMDYSGKEVDAMKVAMPQYLPLSYHAGAAEAAISGAILGKTTSQRKNWAWDHVGSAPIPEYGTTPDIRLQWHNLYQTFASAIMFGDISDRDPRCLNDSLWFGHLWKSNNYYLLTGGYDDARPMTLEMFEVVMPEQINDNEHVYEFNLINGAIKKLNTPHTRGGALVLNLYSSVSAVFMPDNACPPLLYFQNLNSKGQHISAKVGIVADWTDVVVSKAALKISAPGFDVSGVEVAGTSISFDLTPSSASIPSGNYFFQINGSTSNMPLKHWFEWEKQQL